MLEDKINAIAMMIIRDQSLTHSLTLYSSCTIERDCFRRKATMDPTIPAAPNPMPMVELISLSSISSSVDSVFTSMLLMSFQMALVTQLNGHA